MKPGLKPPNITPHYQRNEHNWRVRQEENRLLSSPLSSLNRGSELIMLAGLLADEHHLEITLGTAPRSQRGAKFEAMRPYLRFTAKSFGAYEARRIERDFNKFEYMAS